MRINHHIHSVSCLVTYYTNMKSHEIHKALTKEKPKAQDVLNYL